MSTHGSYANGFAPRDGQPLHPEVWRGCVGAWAPCLGPTGLSLRDWSGFRNNGTLTNMEAGTDWVQNAGMYALDLDATNDSVDAGSVGIPIGSAARTIALWAYQRTRTKNDALVSIGSSGQQFVFQCGDTALYLFTDAVNAANNLNWPVTPTLNVWNHFAFSLRSNAYVAYLNGVAVLSGTFSVSINTANGSVFIGKRFGLSTIDGLIDDVRIYNRALHGNEVKRLATRRGIAYELAPNRRCRVAGFRAFWAARKAQIIGGGL